MWLRSDIHSACIAFASKTHAAGSRKANPHWTTHYCHEAHITGYYDVQVLQCYIYRTSESVPSTLLHSHQQVPNFYVHPIIMVLAASSTH